jgi:hypothetical protein
MFYKCDAQSLLIFSILSNIICFSKAYKLKGLVMTIICLHTHNKFVIRERVLIGCCRMSFKIRATYYHCSHFERNNCLFGKNNFQYNSFTVLSVVKLFSYEPWFISHVSATVLDEPASLCRLNC